MNCRRCVFRYLHPFAACGLLLIILNTGCDRGPTIVPVSGRILLNGKPLTGATITTQPIASTSETPGSGSFGTTNEQGQFDLELVTPKRPGAVVGEHRVMITPPAEQIDTKSTIGDDGETQVWLDDPQSRPKPSQQAWPKAYSDGSLRLKVLPSGVSDVVFELSR